MPSSRGSPSERSGLLVCLFYWLAPRSVVDSFTARQLSLSHIRSATTMSATTDTNNNGLIHRSDGTVVSVRDSQTLFNFGPASERDCVLYTAERPGGDDPSANAIDQWTAFVKTKGITDVLVLLDDNELEPYDNDGSNGGLLATYQQHGFTVHRVAPMSGPGACTAVQDIVQTALDETNNNSNKKVVAHCTHGIGRSGRVAAGWLAMQYGLSPADATQEALATAQKYGIERLGDTMKLEKWLQNV